jgi:hypothetical protein
LKGKVGELNERLGMLMETIQAKDEVIIKLSESEGSVASPTSGPCSPLATPTSRDQLELDRLKVRAGQGLWCGVEIPRPVNASDFSLEVLVSDLARQQSSCAFIYLFL